MTFRILHTADWHVCNEFIGDAVACLEFMVRYAQKEAGPLDLIVISGDIYNHRQIQQETSSARLAFNIVKNLARIAPVAILTGTPSHDGSAPLLLDDIGDRFPTIVVDHPSSWVLYEHEVEAMEFANNFIPIEKKVEGDPNPKAVISFTPAFTKQFFASGSDTETSDQEIAAAMGGIYAKMGTDFIDFNRNRGYKSKPVPHVLLGHYSVGGAFIHPSQASNIGKDIEISREHLDMARASINCLGHIHAAQLVGRNSYYCGSLFATDFGEWEKKGFYIHELELVDMDHHWEPRKHRFIKTPSPVLVKIEIDLIKNAQAPDDLLRYILQQTMDVGATEGVDNYVVRMEIKTYQDEADMIEIDTPDIQEYFKDLGVRSFRLDIVRIPRPNVRSARILEADRLRDKIQTRAEIIDEDIPDFVLDLADDLQDLTHDELTQTISKALEERSEENENT